MLSADRRPGAEQAQTKPAQNLRFCAGFVRSFAEHAVITNSRFATLAELVELKRSFSYSEGDRRSPSYRWFTAGAIGIGRIAVASRPVLAPARRVD
jgi:hypothetical protein